ncbi:hypothetical protein ABZ419_11185 [Streptomyces cinnamoneus]|uniref:hypothetical protein n=1 Tax=Streptomyces cinnamoneus TaxID=53446 RepID=UPI0033C3BC89
MAGATAAPTIEAAFHARTVPMAGGGGHLEWTGYTDKKTGHPVLRYDGRNWSPYRIAFQIRTGREPEGFCGPDCGVSGCVAPEHVDDSATKQRTRRALAALNGQRPLLKECRRGHDLAVHRQYTPKGSSYCGACVTDRMRARRAQTPP